MTRHYLDHASTSPLRPEARAAMLEWLDASGADPSRIHTEGMAARVALEDACEQVAGFFGARSREVVFTSGATEAIAAACAGASSRGAVQVVSAVEHSAVRLSRPSPRLVAVDEHGVVDLVALRDAIDDRTAIVHVQWGNHEVGTVQPVEQVVEICRERGVLLHVDAAQAAGHVPIDFAASGVDLLSVSAHKLGGPPGIGALVIRRGLRLDSLLRGGDQERARRAGLENVLAARGFGAVCAVIDVESEATSQRALTDRIRSLAAAAEGIITYGHPTERLPHLVCLGITDVEPQAVLLGLDRAGIAAHSGSACASEGLEPSPVLEAMGIDAHHSLRLSVGWSTTDADIDALADAFPQVLNDLRALRP